MNVQCVITIFQFKMYKICLCCFLKKNVTHLCMIFCKLHDIVTINSEWGGGRHTHKHEIVSGHISLYSDTISVYRGQMCEHVCCISDVFAVTDMILDEVYLT